MSEKQRFTTHIHKIIDVNFYEHVSTETNVLKTANLY